MATNTFTNVTIPVGTQTFGPLAIPDGLKTAFFSFSNWPSNNTLAAEFDVSTDGGLTWHPIVFMNPTPGNRQVFFGSDAASVTVGPLPAGTGRQGRVIATVAGGSITTTITVTTS